MVSTKHEPASLKPNHDCWKRLCWTCRSYVEGLDRYRASDLRAKELEAERDEARNELAGTVDAFGRYKAAQDARIRELEQVLARTANGPL